MKAFKIQLSKLAEKFFKKHKDLYAKFENNLKSIFNDETSSVDVKVMKGFNNYFRMRLGTYRIIYTLDENGKLIIVKVIKAGSRGDIYK